jgi:phage FluMu protein Com
MSERRECPDCGRQMFKFSGDEIEVKCKHCKVPIVYKVDFDKRTIEIKENELFKVKGMTAVNS